MKNLNAPLLDQLHLPYDLRQLSRDELDQLSQEIRVRLLEIGNRCGGHLASNLGVVELTLALHNVFDSPTDKLIWDTSHQTYVHKMLTGRLDQMFTIRQDNGLCGFANIFESDHDIFGAGHASTALSAALGIAQARELKQESYAVVAILGDASLSGGMAYEALNNIEKLSGNFICILNDNDMSISRPVGSMADYMTRIRTSATYNTAKARFENLIDRLPRIGVPLRRRIEKVVDHFRDTLLDIKVGVIFEEFGFRYLGPIDGHNIGMLMAALKFAKTYPEPVMIHILTKKGKGHQPAEDNPIQYHGVTPKKNAPVTPQPPAVPTYTQVFGKKMIELAEKKPEVVVITPAMKEGSGLVEFANRFPKRFFDVGIAEEHAVTFAAGLCRAGIRPILSIYSTFLQRGFDQLIHDVCLQKLPVIFCLDRAGLVGEDGPTHHGVFDFSYLNPVPNISILAPKDGIELEDMLSWALTQQEAVAIRYPRGAVPTCTWSRTDLQSGKMEVLLDHPNAYKRYQVVLIAVGSMVEPAWTAAQDLQSKGISVALINLRFVKPFDYEGLLNYVLKTDHIWVIEDGVVRGGVGSGLSYAYTAQGSVTWHSIGIPDRFIDHGKTQTLRENLGLTAEGIASQVIHTLDLSTINV